MRNLFRRFFPETLFSRKLDPGAERRLRLAQARAEEGIIRAHVDNALMFVDTLAEDMAFDRAIDTYIREMGVPEPLASVVVTRTRAGCRRFSSCLPASASSSRSGSPTSSCSSSTRSASGA